VTCNTAHYSTGAVRVPTSTELTSYAKTYSGNTGTFDTNFVFTPSGTTVFVFSSAGALTYNSVAQTVASICKDTTLPMMYVEFGTNGSVDFFADGTFTGFTSTAMYQSAGFGTGGSSSTPTISSFSPSSGAVGTTVTITGTNLGVGFTPAPIVKFGTTTVTSPLTFGGQTSISFAVPAGLATGAYTLTIGGATGTPMTVGTFNVSATSGGGTVGVNFTAQNSTTLGFTPNLRKVAWSGSQFVAVGGSGTCNIRTSPDGVTWTAQTIGAACTYLRDVAWSGSQFIAVGYVPAAGSNATIFTSPNGVTWTSRTSGTSNNLQSIACSPSQCIAGGDSGTLTSSSDGITWGFTGTGLSTSLSGGYSLVGMTWTGSQWLATSSLGGYIISSPNGITWTIHTVGGAMYGWSSVASSGTQHVAFGPTGTRATSADGLTWTAQPNFSGYAFETAVWTGSQFIAVGASGTVGTSPDGITWTTQSPTPAVSLYGAVWTGSKIVAVGSNGILTSP
jgi:hypothetical protein